MSETTAGKVATATSGRGFVGWMRNADIGLALMVVAIIAALILPVPPWLLDILLAFSITFAVLVLMTSLFIERPLDFSMFPMVLLITTMLRLSLNVASTRLILAEGHTGTGAAGQVIEAFGSFVMRGNFVIGLVIFGILVIVNLVVITKGAQRISEVAARFSLDGMPGKQMAIDADLSAGLIDENEARERRQTLESESAFFGAMDGASKFVRGDAIAGLLITFVNIIGGIIIGVAQKGLTFADASGTYTLLTVGDALVSQIPALIISTAAGLLISKAGTRGPSQALLLGQISRYPQALGVSGGLLVALGIVPGFPFLPFTMMGLAAGSAAFFISSKRSADVAETLRIEEEKAEAPPAEEPITASLAVDDVRLELGYSLLTLINDRKGYRLTDQIKSLRRQLASEMGFVMPSVRILDNMQLESNSYVIRVREIESGSGALRPGQLLAMDPRGEPITLPGEETTEPTFGLPAMWIAQSHREEASFRGYTVVDPATVITTHLTEVIKENMADLLSYAETQKLLDDLPKENQKLIGDIIPTQISISGIQRVLQGLLTERVSIRNLTTILEAIGEATGYTQNIAQIIEHVRTRIARQISDSVADDSGVIPLINLSPKWEQAFAESIVAQGDEQQLSMAPTQLQEFITRVRQVFERSTSDGENPAVLTSPSARPFVRSIVERFRPATVVLSQNEIHPKAKIRTLGQI